MAEATLSGSLTDILRRLSTDLPKYKRREPGFLDIGGRLFEYADLHSFYYQCGQIFAQRFYDFDSSREDPLILDCGAHIGLASIYYCQRYPKARIRAFEADPAIAAMARRNLASAGRPEVEVAAKAVWIDDKGVCFQNSADDSGHVVNATDGGVIAVPSVRLRDLITAEPVEMLKLDIEGAEFDVLADCDGHLAGVAKMVIEVHAVTPHERGLGAVLAILEHNGYRYTLTDLHQAPWMGCDAKPPFPSCQTEKYLITVLAWRA